MENNLFPHEHLGVNVFNFNYKPLNMDYLIKEPILNWLY